MTSPNFGRGKSYYIISCGAAYLEIGEIKEISKIRKVIKLEMKKFNTNAII